MPTKTKRSTDHGKRDEVLAALRERVLDGTYPPTERLPTVRTIGEEFGTSVLTVHKALQVLVEDGLVVTDGRRGTSVVERPPHLCRYALLLGEEPDAEGRYPSANLAAQAAAAAAWARPGTEMAVYHVTGHHPELPEHQRLLADIDAGRVAGLLGVGGFPTSWLDVAGLGIPAVGAPPRRPPKHWGGLHCIHLNFLRRAVDEAAALGAKRLAALELSEGSALNEFEEISARAAKAGVGFPPHRMLGASVRRIGWVRHVVAALFHGPDTPDALIIGDDNLLPATCTALDHLGIAPGDCQLIALANYPNTIAVERPVLRLGFDHREFLRRGCELIDRYRRRGTAIGDHALPVLREDELD